MADDLMWDLPDSYPTAVEQVDDDGKPTGRWQATEREWHPITLEMWGYNRQRWHRFPTLALVWAKAYDLNLLSGSPRTTAEVRQCHKMLEDACAAAPKVAEPTKDAPKDELDERRSRRRLGAKEA